MLFRVAAPVAITKIPKPLKNAGPAKTGSAQIYPKTVEQPIRKQSGTLASPNLRFIIARNLNIK
jgi:hypothetical protein